MAQATNEKWPFVINLGNSIIGVAVLAMPFCFKQCGILLGMLILLFCTWLTLASCQLLVRAGILSHYRSYEYLAYHTYGGPGKFLVEIGMIGMQLGTLVAQIVVIGDLGPPIISYLFQVEDIWRTRFYVIVILCLFVGLPLGLMKDLRNVSRASTVCISFYAVFSCYVLWQSLGSLWTGEWYSHVNFWRPQGLFQCLPIMSFSFGCQTQLFILYDALPEPSLQAIKGIIHSAVNLCAATYLLVGFLGYVTFYQVDIPGDIITVFPATLATHLIKLGFAMSIVITFPVIIFPCRASIYTLLFQKKSKHVDNIGSSYIPEYLFKGITITIVLGSMITAILIPNVEFILGLNGAITGTLICYIFPALFFLKVSKSEGRTIAQIVLVLGVAILSVSTFTTLYTQDQGHNSDEALKALERIHLQNGNPPQDLVDKQQAIEQNKEDGNVGHLEPPIPFAPGDGVKVDAAAGEKQGGEGKQAVNKESEQKNVNQEAGGEAKAPDSGAKEKSKGNEEKQEQRQEQLLEALEDQQREQQKILEMQKALLEELKDHKEQAHQVNASNKNTPSMHHPQRQNVTTSMVGLKNVHIRKNLTQNGEPQRSSCGTQKKEPQENKVSQQQAAAQQGQLKPQGQGKQQGQGQQQKDHQQSQIQQQEGGGKKSPVQSQVGVQRRSQGQSAAKQQDQVERLGQDQQLDKEHLNPAQQNMIQPDAGQQQVIQPNAGQQQVLQQDAGQQQVLQQDAGQQQVLQQDAGQQQVLQQDAGQQQVLQQDAGQQQVLQQDVGQQQVLQQDAGQQQVLQQDAGQQQVLQQNVGQQQVFQPDVAQQNVLQQNVGQQQVFQPDVAQQNVLQPNAGQQQVLQQNAGQQQVLQQNAGQQQVLQQNAGQQQVLQQNVGQQQVLQQNAGQQEVGQPDAGQQQVLQPNAGQQQMGQPNAGQQQVLQPDVGQQQVLQQNVAQQQVFQQNVGQQEVGQPDVAHQEMLHPNVKQKQVLQPDAV